MYIRYYLLILFIISLKIELTAQIGVIDQNYGSNGFKQVSFDWNPNEGSIAQFIAKDSDGYSYIIGNTSYSGSLSKFQLIKLDKSGKRVVNFGVDGRVFFESYYDLKAIH